MLANHATSPREASTKSMLGSGARLTSAAAPASMHAAIHRATADAASTDADAGGGSQSKPFMHAAESKPEPMLAPPMHGFGGPMHGFGGSPISGPPGGPAAGTCASGACTLQRGVVRTNCIDCLDRTNVAQFAVGRTLLRQQLLTLGFVLSSDVLEVANNLLMRMYEEMGTQLALQYGGSQAVGTPNSNAARDFLQSVKRFYRNTFTDLEKQHIMDVFLGVYTPLPGKK